MAEPRRWWRGSFVTAHFVNVCVARLELHSIGAKSACSRNFWCCEDVPFWPAQPDSATVKTAQPGGNDLITML